MKILTDASAWRMQGTGMQAWTLQISFVYDYDSPHLGKEGAHFRIHHSLPN